MPRSGLDGMNGPSCLSDVSIERAVLPASRAGFDGMIVDHCGRRLGMYRAIVMRWLLMSAVERTGRPCWQASRVRTVASGYASD
jgi:hypothetical protein